MKCSDLQLDLSLYSDGLLSERENASIKSHLEVCPLCRQQNAEYRELRASLQSLKRPAIPENLIMDLRVAVRNELRPERSASHHGSDLREWIQMRLMPYGVGVFASAAVGYVFLIIMFSGMLRPDPVTTATSGSGAPVILASNTNPSSDMLSEFISPTEFAHSRMAFSRESPSINPQGGLAALTKSLLRGQMKDEEVVVVADVFGNGLARISQVVESPRNSMDVLNLEKALQSDPSISSFVPAVMENRPDNMRIVLKFKTVEVNTGN